MHCREPWHIYCIEALQANGVLRTNWPVTITRFEKERPGQWRPEARSPRTEQTVCRYLASGRFLFVDTARCVSASTTPSRHDMNAFSGQLTEVEVSAETIGALINLSGRQRMLSQRIILQMLLASRGDTAHRPACRRRPLLAAHSHRALCCASRPGDCGMRPALPHWQAAR